MLFELLACMHWESLGSLKDEIYATAYVPQLNLNWRAHNREERIRFRGNDLYTFQRPTVKLILENMGDRFYGVSEMCMKR